MPDRSLDVWLLGDLVGRLDQAAGRLAFTYDTGWLRRSHAVPLSASLPLQEKPFEDRAARPFFAGLLPEQDKRDQVARAIGVSERNDFALLDALGGDCAGAVSFTHPSEKPTEQGTDLDYRELDDYKLAAIIDKLPERPLLAGEEGIRLSLAGTQDKLPVLVVDGHLALPLHGAPSSHILKPAIRNIEDSVHNEGFCLALAKAVGLDAAAAEIRDAQGRPYLLVERYDRYGVPTIGRAVSIKRISARRSASRPNTNTRTRAAPQFRIASHRCAKRQGRQPSTCHSCSTRYYSTRWLATTTRTPRTTR